MIFLWYNSRIIVSFCYSAPSWLHNIDTTSRYKRKQLSKIFTKYARNNFAALFAGIADAEEDFLFANNTSPFDLVNSAQNKDQSQCEISAPPAMGCSL